MLGHPSKDQYEAAAEEAGFSLLTNLGYYGAKSGSVIARMRFDVTLTGFNMMNRAGHDNYAGECEFYSMNNPNVPVVQTNFNTSDLALVIRKLKRAEEGIEELFGRGPLDTGRDWKGQRDVMHCILDLEDQLKQVISERQVLSEQRRKKLCA